MEHGSSLLQNIGRGIRNPLPAPERPYDPRSCNFVTGTGVPAIDDLNNNRMLDENDAIRTCRWPEDRRYPEGVTSYFDRTSHLGGGGPLDRWRRLNIPRERTAPSLWNYIAEQERLYRRDLAEGHSINLVPGNSYFTGVLREAVVSGRLTDDTLYHRIDEVGQYGVFMMNRINDFLRVHPLLGMEDIIQFNLALRNDITGVDYSSADRYSTLFMPTTESVRVLEEAIRTDRPHGR